MSKALKFSPHAGRRIKQKDRKIPKDVVLNIARYGFQVKTERIGNWVTRTMRGNYKGTDWHVVVSGNVIRTVYKADEWDMNVKVQMKRHRGVKVQNG